MFCNWETKIQVYLYFVVRWWRSTNISSLASSLPGQECTPFPKGINVLGFGGTCNNIATQTIRSNIEFVDVSLRPVGAEARQRD